jgi:RimJ/RimL family protein N-acetyltransferase
MRSRRWRQREIAYAVTRLRGTGEQALPTAIGVQLVQFAFDRLGLHRVAATCDPRNAASQTFCAGRPSGRGEHDLVSAAQDLD